MGDSWIYGIVDENGRFTGEKNVAYIYQDLELAMVGKYTNGIFVSKKMQLQKKKKKGILIFFPSRLMAKKLTLLAKNVMNMA